MSGDQLDDEAEVFEVFTHDAAEPLELVVRWKEPGEVDPLVHFPRNQVGRWACGAGAGGPNTSLRTERVTCRACMRSRAYAAAVELERVEAKVAARVEAKYTAAHAVRALLWWCPMCQGSGDEAGPLEPGERGTGSRCMHCAGVGLVDDAGAAGWPEARRAPRPPGVRRTPCHDCAYRPCSQEDDAGDRLADAGRAFFCHQGTPLVRGEYVPLLWAGGLPVGSLVCAGWWDTAVLGRPREGLAAAVYLDE